VVRALLAIYANTKTRSLMTKQHRSIVASGSSYGAVAHDEHAQQAVEIALGKMQACTVGSVLLFLSGAYAHKPQNAIKAAAKAAGTPLVFGCCAMGLLTEEEWLLDVEGAVAMVFPSALAMQPLTVLKHQGIKPEQVITLTTPNAAMIAVNSTDTPQVGAIATDEYGHGPFSVWQSGRIVEREFMQAAFSAPLASYSGVAEGVRALSPIMQIEDANGHCLLKLNDTKVTTTESNNCVDKLLGHLPENLHSLGLEKMYNVLCATSENEHVESIENGHYTLQHVVSINQESQQIFLSGSAKKNHYMFWAVRDEQYAQELMLKELQNAKSELSEAPKFAFMFPNISRGPDFFNGQDRDLELFKDIFPDTPLIGFYGNGEIAPGHRYAGLIHRYSTVFSVFA